MFIFGLVIFSNSLSAAGYGLDAQIQQALEYMENNYSNQIDIERLADSVGVSRSYFATKFKAIVGVPPSAYLTATRLRHAKHYLENSNLPIQDIAEAVGFSDTYYFSRVFKKSEAVTPSEYRDLQRKNRNYIM